MAKHCLNRALSWLVATLMLAALAFPSLAAANEVIVYSGRSEPLVAPLFAQFTQETGIRVQVRYGDTAELAATILEEGRNSPADLFFAQDAGALGALAYEGRLQSLPADILSAADARLRSPEGLWVGTSGRARVIVYHVDRVREADLPDSIWDLTHPSWAGRIGWTPTNGSFQAFVTALRVLEGEQRAAEWLRAIQANRPRVYSNNTALYDAVSRGEVHVGLSNHYYLFRFLAEQGERFPARLHFTQGDAGAMVNIAGVGVLNTARNQGAALQLVRFLLSESAQLHFVNENYEYPVIESPNVKAHPLLLPLDEIQTPELDLTDIEDLRGTLDLLMRLGIV